ncbi:HPr family phosphocarrier protein|uniref:Phosphocarrier protein HPr n=1 Tax=Dendrosporobacter quercicolus TaxID=146817 RepID=A0A1G9VSC4_9FIRM|nr:HPr family phosphocarrier protein [Dendrosporobacter quercicolus]NSL47815.1 HPr family phosphocarrier protein [Dendrosporobacter quercicolus DSM 1736]SDM75023.1 phosphocarrier protein [Dendrosporobacter quercicolus]
MIELALTLTNKAGLHARPAAQFVQKAAGFQSKVTIAAGGKTADAKSILAVMSLALTGGRSFTLTVDGADEQGCADALRALVESNFGEV